MASTQYFYLGALPLLLVAGLVALRVGQQEKRKIGKDVGVTLFPIFAIVFLLAEAFRWDRASEEHCDVHWYVKVVVSAQTIAYLMVIYADLPQVMNLTLMAVIPIALAAAYYWGRGQDAARVKCAQAMFLLSTMCTSFTLSVDGEEMYRVAFLVALPFAAMTGYIIGIWQRSNGVNVTGLEE